MPQFNLPPGTDPNAISAEQMERLKNAASAAEATAAAACDASPELEDLNVCAVGRFVCRPLSAAILLILEKTGNRLFADDATEATFEDQIQLLYLLLSEASDVELARQALKGEIAERAIEWSFSLSASDLKAVLRDLEATLSSLQKSFSLYSGISDADEAEKKR